jgi:hypothetical protein
MPLAGWCDVDNDWVWLNTDGSCVNGHGAEHVSRVYDTDEQLSPPPVAQPVGTDAEPPSRRERDEHESAGRFPVAPPVAPEWRPSGGAGAPEQRRDAGPGLALVMGLASILCCMPILTVPAGIIGLILGIKGLKSRQRGLAIAGIVLSSLGLAFGILNVLGGLYVALTQPELLEELMEQLRQGVPQSPQQ